MKKLIFKTSVQPNGQINVPAHIANQLPPGVLINVQLAWDGDSWNEAWKSAGRKIFEAAYAPEDEIYDYLASGLTEKGTTS